MPAAPAVEVEDIGGEAPPVVTVPAIRAAVSGAVGLAGSVDRLRQYATASDRFARASLAMQVMAGIELLDIKRSAPYGHGGKRTRISSRHDDDLPKNANDSASLAKTGQGNDPFAGFATWDAFLTQNLGISVATAGRWIAMAEAARPRLKRLDGWGSLVRDLMERPIATLDPSEIDVLAKAVAKITDGRTQLDFLQELGIVKKPGNPSLGGNTGGRAGSGSGVIDDEAIVRAAQEDWSTIHRGIAGGGMSFTVLPDAEIEAQIDWLSKALRARREWLGSPASARNSATIDTLGKLLR